VNTPEVHETLRTLLLCELLRAKSRIRWRDPVEEGVEDRIINETIAKIIG